LFFQSLGNLVEGPMRVFLMVCDDFGGEHGRIGILQLGDSSVVELIGEFHLDVVDFFGLYGVQ
jgi:hypothetical protein